MSDFYHEGRIKREKNQLGRYFYKLLLKKLIKYTM